PLACVDNKPINRLMSVDSEFPGRNRGIVLWCSHPTCLGIENRSHAGFYRDQDASWLKIA
ncbi:MAG: hypothetical protein ACE5OQ_14310, partial [Woeseia sp.]